MKASTPWFETYKAEFLRTLLFNDHETFDHPLACGYLATACIRSHSWPRHPLHCMVIQNPQKTQA